jgi:serine/threonine-protein kinase
LLAEGTLIADRYRVQKLLGEGAMGVVYLVEHVHMRKRMALKVLHAALTENPELVARFEREAIAAGNIDHPNVVAATDFGRTEQGAFFLVLAYVDGTTLRDVSGVPLEIARAVRITRQITAALARAHELGIVHRDLKPENVMLVRGDGGGGEVVKVLDFGIAKLDADAFAPAGSTPGTPSGSQPLTRKGMIFGTPDYMAPEQALGEVVDARADLYAVGVMLYEMLTGVRPFEAENPVTLMGMHVIAPVPPMRERAPNAEVPGSLEAIARRLLEKKAADRFSTARELGAALDDAALREGLSRPSLPQQRVGSMPDLVPSSRVFPASNPEHAASPESAASSPTLHAAPSDALLVTGSEAIVVPPRRLRPAVLAAGLALTILAAVVTLVTALRGDAKSTPAAGSSPRNTAETAPEREDERVGLRELIRVSEAQGRFAEAAAAVGRLAAIDPSPLDPTSERVIIEALGGTPEAVDAAFSALEGPLGARGVDMLLELGAKNARGASRHAFSQVTQKRLAQSLAKPEVRAHASVPAGIVLELKDAKRCDTKKIAVDHARTSGDERSLAYLKPLTARSGCGFLGVVDCWGCLRKDDVLGDAIAAVEARKREATPADATP